MARYADTLLAEGEVIALRTRQHWLAPVAQSASAFILIVVALIVWAISLNLGSTDLQPEIVMVMEADTAHKFWLGKVNVTMALARGQMKAKGPVAKVLKLVPLTKPIFPRYRQMLEEAGRQDLIDEAEAA